MSHSQNCKTQQYLLVKVLYKDSYWSMTCTDVFVKLTNIWSWWWWWWWWCVSKKNNETNDYKCKRI